MGESFRTDAGAVAALTDGTGGVVDEPGPETVAVEGMAIAVGQLQPRASHPRKSVVADGAYVLLLVAVTAIARRISAPRQHLVRRRRLLTVVHARHPAVAAALGVRVRRQAGDGSDARLLCSCSYEGEKHLLADTPGGYCEAARYAKNNHKQAKLPPFCTRSFHLRAAPRDGRSATKFL